MAGVGQNSGLFVHHPDGYNKLSLLQQLTLKRVTPHVRAAAKSLNKNRDDASFRVVDYGAADGLNSVPMIAACSDELSPEMSSFEWIFNDMSNFDNIHEVEERLSELTGWKEGSVKLQYVVGSFYTQVVPDNSVDFGVSVNAIHWLSHRPSKGCGTDLYHPDMATKAIGAQDWIDFLHCRARELKQGARLMIAIDLLAIGTNSQRLATDKRFSPIAALKVVKDMYDDGVINQEEFKFAQVYACILRTEDDIRAPFQDPGSGLNQNIHLVDIKTYDIPCPVTNKWMQAGGQENSSATEEYISAHMNFIKSVSNSLWKILEVTRSREAHLTILNIFYMRVEETLRANPEGYHMGSSTSVVDMIKC